MPKQLHVARVIIRVGDTVRIVNPDTLAVISDGAEVVKFTWGYAHQREVWVKLRPSKREDMDYDLGNFPVTWIKEVVHRRRARTTKDRRNGL